MPETPSSSHNRSASTELLLSKEARRGIEERVNALQGTTASLVNALPALPHPESLTRRLGRLCVAETRRVLAQPELEGKQEYQEALLHIASEAMCRVLRGREGLSLQDVETLQMSLFPPDVRSLYHPELAMLSTWSLREQAGWCLGQLVTRIRRLCALKLSITPDEVQEVGRIRSRALEDLVSFAVSAAVKLWFEGKDLASPFPAGGTFGDPHNQESPGRMPSLLKRIREWDPALQEIPDYVHVSPDIACVLARMAVRAELSYSQAPLQIIHNGRGKKHFDVGTYERIMAYGEPVTLTVEDMPKIMDFYDTFVTDDALFMQMEEGDEGLRQAHAIANTGDKRMINKRNPRSEEVELMKKHGILWKSVEKEMAEMLEGKDVRAGDVTVLAFLDKEGNIENLAIYGDPPENPERYRERESFLKRLLTTTGAYSHNLEMFDGAGDIEEVILVLCRDKGAANFLHQKKIEMNRERKHKPRFVIAEHFFKLRLIHDLRAFAAKQRRLLLGEGERTDIYEIAEGRFTPDTPNIGSGKHFEGLGFESLGYRVDLYPAPRTFRASREERSWTRLYEVTWKLRGGHSIDFETKNHNKIEEAYFKYEKAMGHN